ncbi:metal ABC transporter permease [Neisseriaceae bacterium PsAf]|nr:metal ABC transporter permease [Neisseriaceae bacterium PsAf]
MYDYLISPFVEYGFMRMALLAVLYQSIGATPIGVFLIMRRMSLVGDALSHAILPGVAIGFLIAGLNPLVMSLMGLLTGLFMILGSTIATKKTGLKEDANFAGFYLTCLALGVILVSKYGTSTDLMSFLFGSLFQVNHEGLLWIASITTITLIVLAIIYRPLYVESIESIFLKIVKTKSSISLILFQFLIVLNLVGGFQTLGTLLSVGLMMIPSITAKLWFSRMESILIGAFCFAFINGTIGLLLSFYFDIASGAMIILCCGIFYMLSLFIGLNSGIFFQQHQKRG